VGVGVGVAVGVAVGVGAGVRVGVGVGDAQASEMVTLSTLQPLCDTELSEHMRQRRIVGAPMPAAGRLTVVVWKPPAPALEMPLQFGRLGKHGFMKPVLIAV
jgi:hypothetical protein